MGAFLSLVSDNVLSQLPLETVADLVNALSYVLGEKFDGWLAAREEALLNRFLIETQSPGIEDNGELIRVHFVTSTKSLEGKSAPERKRSFLHDEALRRISLLRRLVPTRARYGSQGYGHRQIVQLSFDDTQKTGIPIDSMHPVWAPVLNGNFRGLANYFYRPTTIADYVFSIIETRKSVVTHLNTLCDVLVVYFRKQTVIHPFEKNLNEADWIAWQTQLGDNDLLPQSLVDEWGFVEETAKSYSPSMGQTENTQPQRSSLALNLEKYSPFRTQWKSYTQALNGFSMQAREVLHVNPDVGRSKGSRGRSGTTDLRAIGLSVYNLTESLKLINHVQDEFRSLFQHFLTKRELGGIDKAEKQALMRTWNLWYFFAFVPSHVWQNAEQQAKQRVELVRRELRQRIRRELKQLQQQGIRAEIASEELLWDRQPGLWISYDVDEPQQLYGSFIPVTDALRTALRNPAVDSLEYGILNIWYPYVIVMPLFRGRQLDHGAWRLLTPGLLSEPIVNPQNDWRIFQQAIPVENIPILGLEVWEYPYKENINKLRESLAVLWQFAAHLCDLVDLPSKVDTLNEDVWQSFLSEQSIAMNEHFQSTLDEIMRLTRVFQGDRRERPHLAMAFKLLSELHQSLISRNTTGDDKDIRLAFKENELCQWMAELRTMVAAGEMIRLFWLADYLADAS